MAHPQIAIFARLAGENAAPTRVVSGQKTLLSRTMHDIRYDAVHDEIFVGNPFAQAILVFRGGAHGEEAPLRVLQGPHTKLTGPDRLDIDPVHNELFVPSGNGILVFRRDAKGNVAPIREISGPNARMRVASLAVDPGNNLVVALASGGSGEVGRAEDLLIFNRTDSGNAAPRGIIGGSNTGLFNAMQIQVYPPKGWIVVAVSGRPSKEQEPGGGLQPAMEPEEAMVGIWSIHDRGNVAPRWKIGTKGTSVIKRPLGVVLVPEHKELVVTDMRLNGVLTYYFPELF